MSEIAQSSLGCTCLRCRAGITRSRHVACFARAAGAVCRILRCVVLAAAATLYTPQSTSEPYRCRSGGGYLIHGEWLEQWGNAFTAAVLVILGLLVLLSII